MAEKDQLTKIDWTCLSCCMKARAADLEAPAVDGRTER